MKYLPTYTQSHALVIGINDYLEAGPLTYAVNDAEAVSEILQAKFNFPRENITLLIDQEATRAAILENYMNFRTTGENDRVLFYFA